MLKSICRPTLRMIEIPLKMVHLCISNHYHGTYLLHPTEVYFNGIPFTSKTSVFQYQLLMVICHREKFSLP